MVFCAVCGQENVEDAKFCRYCGATIIDDSYTKQNPPNPALYHRSRESVGFGSRRTGEDLVIQCSLCGGQDFAQDTGRLDSKWGMTSFKVVMLTCKHCGHIELFNKGRSIFDFD